MLLKTTEEIENYWVQNLGVLIMTNLLNTNHKPSEFMPTDEFAYVYSKKTSSRKNNNWRKLKAIMSHSKKDDNLERSNEDLKWFWLCTTMKKSTRSLDEDKNFKPWEVINN